MAGVRKAAALPPEFGGFVSTSLQLPSKTPVVTPSEDAHRLTVLRAYRGLVLLIVIAGVILRAVQYAWRTSLMA